MKVGVAGATGALGQEIIAVLEKAPWRPDELVPLARVTTSTAFVSWGGDQIAVDNADDQAMDSLDVLFLALPADAARPLGERAAAEGVTVVDCAGAFGDDLDVPLVVPWVNPEALQAKNLRGIVSTPGPVALLLSSVLGAIVRVGLVARADATVLVPASRWGRAGIEELSSQVIAMFNQGTPQRKVFPSGLAFDLLPVVGEPGDSAWTDEEARAVAETRRLVGEIGVSATVVGVPLFSGIGATLIIQPAKQVPVDLVERILSDAGVQVTGSSAREAARPRRVDGQPFAHVARLRTDELGRIHLFATIDNLRGAAAVAVGTAGALVR